jgi:hypothetical protein
MKRIWTELSVVFFDMHDTFFIKKERAHTKFATKGKTPPDKNKRNKNTKEGRKEKQTSAAATVYYNNLLGLNNTPNPKEPGLSLILASSRTVGAQGCTGSSAERSWTLLFLSLHNDQQNQRMEALPSIFRDRLGIPYLQLTGMTSQILTLTKLRRATGFPMVPRPRACSRLQFLLL